VRDTFRAGHVRYIYYTILGLYAAWSFFCAYLFSTYGTPKLMTLVIANLNNLALGITSIQLLWVNHTLLPRELRPRWYHTLGVAACAVFNLGMAALVFMEKQWPEIAKLFG
jgi:hypothetical protein